MASLDDIQADVTAETTLIGSLGTFIQGLKDQITAAQGDPAKIDEIFAGLEANKAALATALVVNTGKAATATPAVGDAAPPGGNEVLKDAAGSAVSTEQDQA